MQFAGQIPQEMPDRIGPLLRQLAPGYGEHGVRQTQQFDRKMVQRIALIIQLAIPGKRIICLKQGSAKRP